MRRAKINDGISDHDIAVDRVSENIVPVVVIAASSQHGFLLRQCEACVVHRLVLPNHVSSKVANSIVRVFTADLYRLIVELLGEVQAAADGSF